MFDFRYHALSLAAVLIALVVGLLLGVAIGDSNLVSSAEREFRESLRSDVNRANRRADELSSQLEERASRPRSSSARCTRCSSTTGSPGCGSASSSSGGRPTRSRAASATRSPGPAPGCRSSGWCASRSTSTGLAERAAGTRYARVDRDGDLVEPFGVRMGVQLVAGGKLVREVRPSLLRSFNGTLRPLDAIVVFRGSPELEGRADAARDTFENGLVRGMNRADVPVVGVELRSTDPSQVGWYRERRLASVDSVDAVAGRAALVFALQGTQGAFGVKDTAEALLPNVADGGRDDGRAADLHRDRDLGRLLDDSFSLYRRHFWTLLVVAAAVVVPVELAVSGFGLGQLTSGYDETTSVDVAIVQTGVAMLVITPLLTAMVVIVVLDAAKGGAPSASTGDLGRARPVRAAAGSDPAGDGRHLPRRPGADRAGHLPCGALVRGRPGRRRRRPPRDRGPGPQLGARPRPLVVHLRRARDHEPHRRAGRRADQHPGPGRRGGRRRPGARPGRLDHRRDPDAARSSPSPGRCLYFTLKVRAGEVAPPAPEPSEPDEPRRARARPARLAATGAAGVGHPCRGPI